MIRKSKKFLFPKKRFEKQRILDENKVKEKYGLKNKREIWKNEAKIKYFRNRAKQLITAQPEEQELFIKKLKNIGFKVNNISDVLSIDKEELLNRRLVSIVWKKGLANTAKHARQMVVHKKILVNGKVVNIPSYLVDKTEENHIEIKKIVKNSKIVEKEVIKVGEEK